MRVGRHQARGGFVLVAVLVVILLASMVAVSLMFRMRAEETAAAAGVGAEQAWAVAMAGVGEAMRLAAQSPPGSLEWQDNPAAFEQRLVLDDGVDRWFFSVFSLDETATGDGPSVRFGLSDEASKLHLEAAEEEQLLKLPGMTAYLAQGLLDFLDGDDLPRVEGAEQEYYDALPVPYWARNDSLATLGELLLVRGITPALLYGEKRGRPGLASYLTVAAYDLNIDGQGFPRMNVNAPDEVALTDLPEPVLNYLGALHRQKIVLDHPADLLEARGTFKDENGREVELESGVGKDELASVLDQLTVESEERLVGLLNLNTAPAAVLQTLPEVDAALAEAIVSTRSRLDADQRRTPAWLYTEQLVDAERFKKLVPYLTARSLQFRFQVVAYAVPSGRYRVFEVMIDLGQARPAISYLRDITRLGLPFPIVTDTERAHG